MHEKLGYDYVYGPEIERDYTEPLRNTFTIANQWTVEELSVRRADIIVFVNGLPLVVVELKSPSRENTDTSKAYTQLRNHMIEIPSLFVYNTFCVMSDWSPPIFKAETHLAAVDCNTNIDWDHLCFIEQLPLCIE